MSVYDAQFISDLDGDGSPEVLAVHGGDELSDPGEACLKILKSKFICFYGKLIFLFENSKIRFFLEQDVGN